MQYYFDLIGNDPVYFSGVVFVMISWPFFVWRHVVRDNHKSDNSNNNNNNNDDKADYYYYDKDVDEDVDEDADDEDVAPSKFVNPYHNSWPVVAIPSLRYFGIRPSDTHLQAMTIARKRMMESHPDKGGTNSQFVVAREHYNKLKDIATRLGVL